MIAEEQDQGGGGAVSRPVGQVEGQALGERREDPTVEIGGNLFRIGHIPEAAAWDGMGREASRGTGAGDRARIRFPAGRLT